MEWQERFDIVKGKTFIKCEGNLFPVFLVCPNRNPYYPIKTSWVLLHHTQGGGTNLNHVTLVLFF